MICLCPCISVCQHCYKASFLSPCLCHHLHGISVQSITGYSCCQWDSLHFSRNTVLSNIFEITSGKRLGKKQFKITTSKRICKYLLPMYLQCEDSERECQNEQTLLFNRGSILSWEPTGTLQQKPPILLSFLLSFYILLFRQMLICASKQISEAFSHRPPLTLLLHNCCPFDISNNHLGQSVPFNFKNQVAK